jgi:hypothetical protein
VQQVAALLGDGAVERALASLAEMISAPLLRLALRGDLPTLVDRLRPLVESLLKLAANRELPEAQRVAAYRQATRDAVDSAYTWLRQVALASDSDAELCSILDWVADSWRAFQTTFEDLETLAQEALGEAEARALWEAMRNSVHRWRFLNETRDRLSQCDAAERLLPHFERQLLRSGWGGLSRSLREL